VSFGDLKPGGPVYRGIESLETIKDTAGVHYFVTSSSMLERSCNCCRDQCQCTQRATFPEENEKQESMDRWIVVRVDFLPKITSCEFRPVSPLISVGTAQTLPLSPSLAHRQDSRRFSSTQNITSSTATYSTPSAHRHIWRRIGDRIEIRS